MLTATLQQFLTTSAEKTSKSKVIFWFSLSLTFAAIFGLLVMRQAFSSEYIVQDDARQHVFWMQRFSDPGLFPQDIIADYFQSTAPGGFATFYWVFAKLGVPALLLAKFLPVILGLIATAYCFGVVLQILPVPIAGFITALLLNYSLWVKDDLASATPRAFLYPFFLAFLYYFLRRFRRPELPLWKTLVPALVAIALQGLFYPTTVFLIAGLLLLQPIQWRQGLRLSRDRRDYLFCMAGLVVAFLVLLPYALESSQFGPTLSAAEARTMPELQPGGRTGFFNPDPWVYWFTGRRSSIRLPLIFTPPLMIVGLLLPIFWRLPDRFPLVRQLTPGIAVLPRLVIASFGLFFAAHAVLFKLHHPDRYTQHSLRIVVAIATGIVLAVLLDALFRWIQQSDWAATRKQLFSLATAALLGVVLLAYPVALKLTNAPFPAPNYQTGRHPELYQFFAQQPKDSLIASLSDEANKIPSFSARSILVSSEYALPFHMGFYNHMRQRAIALIRAQYSPNLSDVQKLIRDYGVDFWLLDRDAFTPQYLIDNNWMNQYQPVTKDAISSLEQGRNPALATVGQRCSVFETEQFLVLKAACLTKSPT